MVAKIISVLSGRAPGVIAAVGGLIAGLANVAWSSTPVGKAADALQAIDKLTDPRSPGDQLIDAGRSLDTGIAAATSTVKNTIKSPRAMGRLIPIVIGLLASRSTPKQLPASGLGFPKPWAQMGPSERAAFQHTMSRHGQELGLNSLKISKGEAARVAFNSVAGYIRQNGVKMPGTPVHMHGIKGTGMPAKNVPTNEWRLNFGGQEISLRDTGR